MTLFNSLIGQSEFEKFTNPVGQSYIGVYMFIFKIFFMSLLVAMFINKYDRISSDLEAIKRFEVISLKNSISYDK